MALHDNLKNTLLETKIIHMKHRLMLRKSPFSARKQMDRLIREYQILYLPDVQISADDSTKDQLYDLICNNDFHTIIAFLHNTFGPTKEV